MAFYQCVTPMLSLKNKTSDHLYGKKSDQEIVEEKRWFPFVLRGNRCVYCHTGAVKMQKEKWGNLTSVYQRLANSHSAHPSTSGIKPEGQATFGKSSHFSEPQPPHL